MIASSQGRRTNETAARTCRGCRKPVTKFISISVRNFIPVQNQFPVRNQCQWLIGFPFEISVKRIESTPHLFRNQYQNLIEFLFEIYAKSSCSKSMSMAHCIPVRTQCQTRHRHRLQCSLHCHLTRHIRPHHFWVE